MAQSFQIPNVCLHIILENPWFTKSLNLGKCPTLKVPSSLSRNAAEQLTGGGSREVDYREASMRKVVPVFPQELNVKSVLRPAESRGFRGVLGAMAKWLRR